LLEFTANAPLLFTGGIVQQVLGTISPAEVRFDINGLTFAKTSDIDGEFTFTTPIEVVASQSIFIVGNG
jgi:hypothetical protein